jgi:hypothetical protein
MAEEAYMVAFDIQESSKGNQGKGAANFPSTLTGLGVNAESSVGFTEYEGNGTTEPGLYGQGILSGVAIAKLVEVKAGSAAEAVEVVRKYYGSNAGGERAVVKPNKTNFKLVA